MSSLIIFYVSAVAALLAIKRSLIDPMDHLKNWTKGDPCIVGWTGVVCNSINGTVGNLRVKELYVLFSTLPFLYYYFFIFPMSDLRETHKYSTSVREGNEAFLIRVWKPLPSRRILKPRGRW